MSSKPPAPSGLISYPNNITDHQVVTKMREIIDHINNTKTTISNNADAAQLTADGLAALPKSFLTHNDVNTSINTWATISLTKPPEGIPTFIQVLNSGLVQLGFTVPTPPSTTGAPVISSAAKWQALTVMHWGPRQDKPLLGRDEAGFLYYVVDYGHLAMWDEIGRAHV